MSRLRGPRVVERDTRVKVYAFTPTESGGRVTPRYTLRSEAWASYETAPGTERGVGGAPQHESDATFGFHEGVTVAEQDVLVVVDGGAQYRVTNVPDKRSLVPGRLRMVRAVRADTEQFTLVG